MTGRRVLLAAAGLGLAALPSLRSAPPPPTAVARVGAFTDALVESGTLGAARVEVYAAPLSATPAKIVELVPEGTDVRAGDRLIRFDTSALELALAQEESTKQALDADRLRYAEELRVETLRAESDLQSAQDRVASAEQALANDVDGQGRVDAEQANATAAEAGREAARTRQNYEDLKPLLAEGFITRVELQRSEQEAARAEANARLASMRAQATATYSRPAAIAKSRAELGTARDAVGRLRDMAAARLHEASAALALADTRVAESSARLRTLEAQIAASVVTARGPGLVMYRDAYFAGERRKPQVGDDVAPNQPVLVVPDASHLNVETRIREVDVRHVAAGARAAVRVDAFPDLVVPASVTLVGALALEDPGRAGTRFFPVTVALGGFDPRLRPGMTARVEIPTVAIPRAVLVPVAAVFESNGASYCLVIQGRRSVRRPVTIAATNATEAAIQSGLMPGERVSLADPDAEARGER